jgi:hypothetical protein
MNQTLVGDISVVQCAATWVPEAQMARAQPLGASPQAPLGAEAASKCRRAARSVPVC